MAPSAIAMTSLRGLGPLPRIVADAAGPDALDRLYVAHGLPVEPDLARGMIPVDTMMGLFEDAARLIGDETFGLRVGDTMVPQDYGPWVTYAMAAPVLREALDRLQRSLRLHQSHSALALRVEGRHARLSYRPGAAASAPVRHHFDHALLPMIRFIRHYAGPAWSPLAVELPYADGPWRAALGEATGALLRFGHSFGSVVFDAALLDRPAAGVRPPDRLTIGDLRRMIAGRPPRTMVETVLSTLHLRLLEGACDIDGTAAFLGLGPRSLQRRLALEGTTYRALVDVARFERARDLLQESRLTMTSIALDLGYEDPSHFARAFRRWAETSPGDWRRAVAPLR